MLADSFKLGLRPFLAWARLAPWTVVTDDGADPDHVQKFRGMGVQAAGTKTICLRLLFEWHP